MARDRTLGVVCGSCPRIDRRVLRVGKVRLASMTAVAWMIGAGLVSWLVTREITDGRGDPEGLLGMGGPLVSGIGRRIAYVRAYRSAPGRLTNVMVTALAVKMVFFGGYVGVMLRGLNLRPRSEER